MIRDKLDLSGKVVLVVGGRGYLGVHFCEALVECGAKVYSADLTDESDMARTASISPSPAIKQCHIDVTDDKSVKRLVNNVLENNSRIDVLVYAATAKPSDFYMPFIECSLEGWQQVFQVEMDGLFLVTQQVGRLMEEAGVGSIIFLSSIYGIVGNDQRIYEGSNLSGLYAGNEVEEGTRIYSHAAYPAVKGAVISLTRYLAAYWEGQNIRVNCISPGGVAHPGENEEFIKRYSEHVPLGRKADAEEISGAVVFLASDASTYVNGHNLVVDGGWTAW